MNFVYNALSFIILKQRDCIFYLPFVKSVLLDADFIEVERFDILEWADVQDEVAAQLANYLNQGGQVQKQAQKKG